MPPFETAAELERHPRHPLLTWLPTAVGVVLLVALLAWWWWPLPQPPPEEKLRAVSVPPIIDESDPDALPATPVDTVWFWKADVDTRTIYTPWRLGSLEFFLLGLAALATAGAAWWWYRRRFPDLPPTS